MVGGQIDGRVGIAPVAWAPVPVLAAMPGDHSRTEALPCLCAVQRVMATAVRLSRMHRAAAAGSACDDAADGAKLHGPARPSRGGRVLASMTPVTLECTPFDIAGIVSRGRAGVYRPAVLVLRDQDLREWLALGAARPGRVLCTAIQDVVVPTAIPIATTLIAGSGYAWSKTLLSSTVRAAAPTGGRDSA